MLRCARRVNAFPCYIVLTYCFRCYVVVVSIVIFTVHQSQLLYNASVPSRFLVTWVRGNNIFFTNFGMDQCLLMLHTVKLCVRYTLRWWSLHWLYFHMCHDHMIMVVPMYPAWLIEGTRIFVRLDCRWWLKMLLGIDHVDTCTYASLQMSWVTQYAQHALCGWRMLS